MKRSFLGHEKPLLTTMVQCRRPIDFISLSRSAVFHGCDALGFQIEQFEKEYRTEEEYKKMFYFADGKPIYVTNYRGALNEGMTDDELVDGLILAAKCGGTILDLMGDLFDPSPDQLTKNPQAIQKQKDTIARIHDMGAEVLMSCHTMRYMTADEVTEMALEQEKRGADVCKIVAASNTEEEMLKNLETTALLKKVLKVPYLFLSTGPYCKMHRTVGPMLGCCTWLTVDRYDELATKDQPLLSETRAVINNFDWTPHGIE